MRARVSPELLKRLKKLNVRIRNKFLERIEIFENNNNDPVLNNHPLKREYEGYRSIDITDDYRALYRDINKGEIAYFSLIDTHKGLYGN